MSKQCSRDWSAPSCGPRDEQESLNRPGISVRTVLVTSEIFSPPPRRVVELGDEMGPASTKNAE